MIDDGAFYECNRLEVAVIPEGLKKLGDGAFRSCRNLKKVVLPEGLTEIGEYSFVNCPELKHVYLPASLKEIGRGTFYLSEYFKWVNKEIIIHTPKGSAAQKYAVINDIQFDNNY